MYNENMGFCSKDGKYFVEFDKAYLPMLLRLLDFGVSQQIRVPFAFQQCLSFQICKSNSYKLILIGLMSNEPWLINS